MRLRDHFVAFDTETTGLGPDARILEVAVAHYYRGVFLRGWSTFIEPDESVGKVDWESHGVKKALEINHITRDQLKGYPSFNGIMVRLFDELGAHVWVAHNAPFDLRMLKQELVRLKERPPTRPEVCLCTKALDQQLSPGVSGFSLATVTKRWGVTPEGAHRALVDARACGDVLLRMIPKFEAGNDFAQLKMHHQTSA